MGGSTSFVTATVGDPVGARIDRGDGQWRTVVGVAANVLPMRRGIPAAPMVYVASHGSGSVTFEIGE